MAEGDGFELGPKRTTISYTKPTAIDAYCRTGKPRENMHVDLNQDNPKEFQFPTPSVGFTTLIPLPCI